MNDNDKIEYVDYAPAEINWFRLELPFADRKTESWYSPRGLSKIQYLSYTKALMAHLGFTINVDFKIASDYYSKSIILLIHPDHEKYASWIRLRWDPK